MLAWARDFDLFRHTFQTPTGGGGGQSQEGEWQGRDMRAQWRPCRFLPLPSWLQSPGAWGRAILLQALPAKRGWGLAFPQWEELAGLGDADLQFTLGHVHFLLTIEFGNLFLPPDVTTLSLSSCSFLSFLFVTFERRQQRRRLSNGIRKDFNSGALLFSSLCCLSSIYRPCNTIMFHHAKN